MTVLATYDPGIAERAGVLAVSAVGLRLDEEIRFNDWRDLLDEALRLTDGGLWYIADLVAFGWKKVRTDPAWLIYASMIEARYSRQGVYDLGTVGRKVDISRRREILSFTHHREVASLEPDEQEAWLDDAIAHNWSTRELRDEIRKARGGGQPALPSPPRIVLRRPDRPEWETAAERRGMALEAWAESVLDAAAGVTREAAA